MVDMLHVLTMYAITNIIFHDEILKINRKQVEYCMERPVMHVFLFMVMVKFHHKNYIALTKLSHSVLHIKIVVYYR